MKPLFCKAKKMIFKIRGYMYRDMLRQTVPSMMAANGNVWLTTAENLSLL